MHAVLCAPIDGRRRLGSVYDGRPVPPADLDRVLALPLEPGVIMQAVTDAAGMERVVEYVEQGNLAQYADRAYVDELIYWLRFTK